MTLPDGYVVRAATRDDAQAITDMFVEQEMLLYGRPESTVEDLFDDWAMPGMALERDTWTVLSDGVIVGYAGVVKKIPPDTYAAYGGVRPSYWGRGLGSFLFATVERRVLEKIGGPASVRLWVDAKDEAALALLKSRGYRFVRRFWRMDVTLDEKVLEPGEVDGVTIRSFERGRDERRAHEVLEEAFSQHWGFTARTYEEAAVGRWEAEWFQPDVSLVAEVDGEMVAVSINSQRLEEGSVEDIGVLPSWRGRGIAEALLRRSFWIFKGNGLRSASLNVDSDNSTGAMRLYERVGMSPATSHDIYEVRVEP